MTSQEELSRLTEAVVSRMAESPDPRFKSIMTSLVRKLHEFIREVDLSSAEWFTAIEFLTAAGQACNDKRQEFILMSDTLGASMMVVMLEQIRAIREGGTRATAAGAATEATVEGPFYWQGAPEYLPGADLAEGVVGEPAFYSGRVLDTEGKPIAGAQLDIWSGDGEGRYDTQIEGAGMAARGKIRTDEQGRYRFRSIKPAAYHVPKDGPVGRMLAGMGRHAYRPGHIHMKVSAPGHLPVTTHLFVADSPYIDSDAVFGVRDSLVVEFQRHPPGGEVAGQAMEQVFYTAQYDFRLAPFDSRNVPLT